MEGPLVMSSKEERNNFCKFSGGIRWYLEGFGNPRKASCYYLRLSSKASCELPPPSKYLGCLSVVFEGLLGIFVVISTGVSSCIRVSNLTRF